MSNNPKRQSRELIAGEIRRDFPILSRKINGKRLVYLDNAATTQKPQAVIDAVTGFYERSNANVHRGLHALSARATEAYETARETAARFLNSRTPREIVFVRGATEAINLVVDSYGRDNVGSGDEVIITAMEHHSNLVPWQLLCRRKGAKLRVAPMSERGEIIPGEYNKLFSPRTKIAAITYVSNAIGTVNPVAGMIAAAHEHGVPVLVDGAQAAPHLKIDVQALDCDFLAFSGHKTYGPTGIGVLYARESTLNRMRPYQSGGDMIATVTFEQTTFTSLPHRFEAGTPNVAGAVGLGAALDYIENVGLDNITSYEDGLLAYAAEALAGVPGVVLVGAPARRAGSVSFNLAGIHPHDAGLILDREGIAVRGGHHCSQPLMDFFGVPATLRASVGVYNTREDIDALVAGLHKVREVFG